MERVDLNLGWSAILHSGDAPEGFRGVVIPATVPGTIHTDLLDAGLIADPYVDENEPTLSWLWRSEWRYCTEFKANAASAPERIELVFDGLDTVATISLNGVKLGRTINMHRSHRFDVTELVVEGTNKLEVIFTSALEYATQVEQEVGFRPRPYEHPYHAIRKMACSFGWDWGPNLQTAGIWKGVRLERWQTARFESVRPSVRIDATRGLAGNGQRFWTVEVHVALTCLSSSSLTVKASVAGREATLTLAPGGCAAVIVVEVGDVDLWCPHGHGLPSLYDLTVELRTHSDLLDSFRRRIGFRTLELDMSDEGTGAGFTFVVNGQRIFIKGANWIPDDHLMTRITKARLRRRIQQALDANMNLLRVWGGGIYETEEFYDLCDEMGILVWQDFPFACAAYHEGSTLLEEVVAEARENVARLTSHASLAIYNGSNENIWGFCDWGWREKIGGDGSWGIKYYEQILPGIVAELDPLRPYIPSSPFSPHHHHDAVHPNDPAWGPVHEWEVWNRVDYLHYRDYVPRFCAEFGFQGPATWATLRRTLPAEAFDQNHPAWLLHQKAEDGNGKLNRGFSPHLPAPVDFESWHWATSLNQARAIQFAIEHYRSTWPVCAGAIVWQLNDCWPVTSWAAIDGDERKKPLWYALRHAYAPRLLTFQPRAADGTHDSQGEPHLVAVNDSSDVWEDTVVLERISVDGVGRGARAFKLALKLALEPWQSATFGVQKLLEAAGGAKSEVLVATTGTVGTPDHARALWAFAEDKDMPYLHAPYRAEAKKVPGGYEITIEAHAFVRDMTVLADKVSPDAEVDDALISLLPGEAYTFHVSTHAVVEPQAFLVPSVLVSVGSLFR